MRITAITLCAMLTATVGTAQEIAPADVAFTEFGEVAQSLSGVEGNAENGAVIMKTRSKGNCIACHAVAALSDAPFHGEVGPVLDDVGGYRSVEELRGIVANAKKMFPDTVMPAFYKTSGFIRPGDGYTGKAAQEEDLTPLLTAQEIEDVVAFLLTLKGG